MKILAVEDEKKIADFLKKSLKEEGFVVDIAEDGEQGVYMARINQYDMIILDNLLPKKNGLEVCKELREKGKTMPILMLSVKSDTNTKVELLNAGADDYLSKPFSFEELLARIHALLRRQKPITKEVLRIGNIVLDTKRCIVTIDKKRVHLTHKEFALLEYLMRNKGIVLSRGMIMEHVWDMNADPFSNTIESHIRSLRRKIDDCKKNKLIHTVSGRGYKIDLHA